MNAKIESLTAAKKRAEVEVPAEHVQRELDCAYKEVNQRARIRGFRPGKIPRAVLERYFGDEIRRNIRSKLIQETLSKLIEEHGLKVIGSPEVDPSELKYGRGFSYTVTMEVKPEVELKEYRGLKLSRTKPQVSDADVEQRLLKMQADHAQLDPVENREVVETGDVLVVDWDAGTREGKHEGEVVELGSGHWKKEIEEGLIGVHRGEERIIRIPSMTPQEKEGPLLRITVKEIKQKRLLPIDDNFARESGESDSLEELKLRVKSDLQGEAEKRERERLEEDLITQLIVKNPFEVPEQAIENQLDFLLTGTESKASGTSEPSAAESARNALRQGLRAQALRQIQRSWLLERIAEQENIRVEDKDCDLEIERLARETDRGILELRRFFAQENRREELKARTRQKKALDFLMGLAQIDDAGP